MDRLLTQKPCTVTEISYNKLVILMLLLVHSVSFKNAKAPPAYGGSLTKNVMIADCFCWRCIQPGTNQIVAYSK